MAKPRLPSAVADATGAAARNPKRFANRKPIKSAPLGKAPRHFTVGQIEAWDLFADEMPWLTKGDRMVVEVAARLRDGMKVNPDFPIAGYAQLRMCLSSMGGTPADRSKVSAPDDEDQDPADKFFN